MPCAEMGVHVDINLKLNDADDLHVDAQSVDALKNLLTFIEGGGLGERLVVHAHGKDEFEEPFNFNRKFVDKKFRLIALR